MAKILYLRAFELDDISFIHSLRSDESFFELTCSNRYFISSERDKKWLEDKIVNNNHQLYLMVCTVKDNLPVGYICATDIDYLNKKAQWGGLIIAKEHAGKGYGTKAGELLLEHLFFELGMNMIYGYWREDHPASLRMAEKLGFRKDGLVRDFVFKQNKFHNVFICTILKSDFRTTEEYTLSRV